MRMQRWDLLAVILLMMVLPSFAHHGNAAYDTSKTVTVHGTIMDFSVHKSSVMVFFEAKDEKGNIEKWQGKTFKPGTRFLDLSLLIDVERQKRRAVVLRRLSVHNADALA